MNALILLLLLQTGAVTKTNISGNVVDAGAPDSRPLYHARLELDLGSGPSLVAITDGNGRFAFPNLNPGRYRLTITRDGYLRKSAIVAIAAGQPRNDVLIALDAAPTLFGRIHDPNNIPISDILVEAIKVVYGPRGDRSLVTLESALSDDRGEYHLYWLDPGEYYIRASSLASKPDQANSRNAPPDARAASASVYAPTFYPGFRDPRDATLIRLRVGSNLTGFDFKLQQTSAISLAGHVYIEATGQDVNTRITATVAGAVASLQKYEGMSPKGEFSLSGMLPATYIVSAQFTTGGQQLTVHRKFTLKGFERAFILQLSPGSTVSGGMVPESGGALDLRSTRLALDSVDPDLPSPQIAKVDANGQFTSVRVEPGDYAIRILDLPGDVYMKSARSGDKDILAKPFRIDYVSPAPVRVVLGMDGSRLEGVVVDAANRPFADAQVVLVPDAARRNSPDQFRTATSDDAGRFALRGIPPGEYKLFAWQSMEPNAYMNENYLRDYESAGQAFTVPASSAGSTTVRLIPVD